MEGVMEDLEVMTGEVMDIEALEIDKEVLMDQEETFPQDQDLEETEVRGRIFQPQG